MGNFLYIDKQEQLNSALEELSKAPRIAIDTESSGYYTYFSDLCLIQVSAGGRHYIIDPLAEIELAGFAKLCRDPTKTKIFHSAASDIMEMKRAFNWDFSNVFDTFLSSRFLAHANCSLSSLVAEYEGVSLEKKEQKSNWKQRPLSQSQLEYAHLDTFYLESLMDKLKKKLEDCGIYEELLEEFALVCECEIEPQKEVNPMGWRHIPQAKQLSMEEQAMLRELYLLRDARGREENIAPFRILSNFSMIQLVRDRPDNLSKPALSKAFHPSFLRKDKDAIIDILKGENIDILSIEREEKSRPRPDPKEKNLLKKLKKWRNRVAEYRGIDPSMVITSRTLSLIANRLPQDISDLEKLDKKLSSWKIKNYGQQILDIIAGEYDGSLSPNLPRLPDSLR